MRKRTITILCALVFALTCLAGCGGTVQTETATAETATTETATTENTQTESVETAPYFTKGVYVNYAAEAENPPMDYFYAFYDEGTGFTDDGTAGIGVPFSCTQKDGSVEFSFGGEGELTDVLTITSVEDGSVRGHFDDGLELMFVPVPDVNPFKFDAKNYMKAASGEALTYHDANGWSVTYDPNLFTVNGGGPTVSFVYTGESAGTNMITASYNVDGKDAKTAIADLAKEWGDETVTNDAIFPGTDDVTGYFATLSSGAEGSGLYCVAMARDYMDGYLLIELTGHNSGNEELDMAVSDALTGIIDSLEFTDYTE